MPLPQFTIESFWSKVDRREADECWPWMGHRQASRGNYGRYGTRLAHRVAYELHHGQAPDGLCVCHACDNPPCCNPNHLFLGTRSDNMFDMWAKARRRKAPKPEHCIRCGHRRIDDYVFRHVSGRMIERCRACANRRRKEAARRRRHPEQAA